MILFLIPIFIFWLVQYPEVIIAKSKLISVNYYNKRISKELAIVLNVPRDKIELTTQEDTGYFAEIYIQKKYLNRIKTGQDVLIKFTSYPFQKYGNLVGKINFVSNHLTDSGYLAKIYFKNGLITDSKMKIQYREDLLCQAEIITSNMNLLQWIYHDLFNNEKTHSLRE